MTTLEREGVGSKTIIAMLIALVNCELADLAHLDNQAGTPDAFKAFRLVVIVYQIGHRITAPPISSTGYHSQTPAIALSSSTSTTVMRRYPNSTTS
jgi:hypothetical protein